MCYLNAKEIMRLLQHMSARPYPNVSANTITIRKIFICRTQVYYCNKGSDWIGGLNGLNLVVQSVDISTAMILSRSVFMPALNIPCPKKFTCQIACISLDLALYKLLIFSAGCHWYKSRSLADCYVITLIYFGLDQPISSVSSVKKTSSYLFNSQP